MYGMTVNGCKWLYMAVNCHPQPLASITAICSHLQPFTASPDHQAWQEQSQPLAGEKSNHVSSFSSNVQCLVQCCTAQCTNGAYQGWKIEQHMLICWTTPLNDPLCKHLLSILISKLLKLKPLLLDSMLSTLKICNISFDFEMQLMDQKLKRCKVVNLKSVDFAS